VQRLQHAIVVEVAGARGRKEREVLRGPSITRHCKGWGALKLLSASERLEPVAPANTRAATPLDVPSETYPLCVVKPLRCRMIGATVCTLR